jgi:hypothetical protein
MISFGALTALYGLSTVMIILFGYETHHRKGIANTSHSRLKSFVGVGSVVVPKTQTLLEQSKDLLVMIFNFPLLLTGKCLDIGHRCQHNAHERKKKESQP